MEELIRQLSTLRAIVHGPDYAERSAETAAAVDAALDLAQRLRDELAAWYHHSLCRLAEQRLGGMQLAGPLECGPESHRDIN